MSAQSVNTIYIDPKNTEQFDQVADYTLANGRPAVDIACIFAGNYAASTAPYLRANNNNPPTDQPFNANIQGALDSGAVAELQAKGLKVLLTVTNGWSSVGWSEFTSESEAESFVTYLKEQVVDRYGLDGIDIDDEYSKGAPNDHSLIMVTTIMKSAMPGKLITKALFRDQQYFQAKWNGHTLAEILDYGWQMSYGAPPQDVLPFYTQHGMRPDQLSMGFDGVQPPAGPSGNVSWLKDNGYMGLMMFGFENQSSVNLMGVLVDDWDGPGNWNPPA